MTSKEYDDFVRSTAIFPKEHALAYLTCKLAGEAGEVAEKVGKTFRGDYTIKDIKDQLILELGDVLWYLSALAQFLGYSIEEVMEANVTKLQSRKDRGVLQGDGDTR